MKSPVTQLVCPSLIDLVKTPPAPCTASFSASWSTILAPAHSCPLAQLLIQALTYSPSAVTQSSTQRRLNVLEL